MLYINLEGVPDEDRGAVRAQIDGSTDLTEDASSDLRVWLMQPGVESAGEPANIHPIAQAVWVAARGDVVVCRTRAPSENTLLIRDLQRLARYEAVRDLQNPTPPEALQGGVRIAVVDADGQAVSDTVMDGEHCDYVVHNDSAVPVWVTLLELGADRSVSPMFPWEPGVGERIAPGAKFALGGDFLARHPDFESVFSVGIPADHPWVVQPGPILDQPAPCVLTLKVIVTTAAVELAVDGDVAQVRAALESGSGDWTCVHHDLTVRARPPAPTQVQTLDNDGREISPTGSGYVLVYWAEKLSGAPLGGCLGITAADKMPQMGENFGYWKFPLNGTWPAKFRLRPGLQGKSTVDGTGLPESQAINQFTGSVRRTNRPFTTSKTPITLTPSQVDQAWKVTGAGGTIAHMARVGEDLYWFTQTAMSYLPKDMLVFESAPLPTAGSFYSAIDKKY